MPDIDALFQTAEMQEGFFTFQQALDAGYVKQSCDYHVGTGAWIREGHGLYRLSRFPWSEGQELVKWFLWSRNRKGEPQGVFSHVTALALHGLSDASPSKIDMTVPLDFKRRKVPSKLIDLHFENLYPIYVCKSGAVLVTTEEKTLFDLITLRYSHDILLQAAREALAERRISPTSIESLSNVKMKEDLTRLIEDAGRL